MLQTLTTMQRNGFILCNVFYISIHCDAVRVLVYSCIAFQPSNWKLSAQKKKKKMFPIRKFTFYVRFIQWENFEKQNVSRH